MTSFNSSYSKSYSDKAIAPEDTALPALQTINLSFFYGTRKVLEGITMAVSQQRVTAIIGPSGCGKSTFVKALNRIGELEAQVRVKGRVEFFGQDIYHPRVNLNRLRQQIGMVFQKPNPFAMSIYENVAYGIRIAESPTKMQLDQRVESALVGAALWDEVKDHLHKSAFGLSGGQQQRLCIARALAVKPKVLLMDEPCSALDPIATMKIEDLIHSLRTELTIAIVTHNMQQAARVSDYTAFFSTDESRIGRMVEFGETAQIFGGAVDQRTRDYVAGRFG
jgi:phosphate transport system ATP-binding protein